MMKRFLIAAFILNLMLPTFAISYEDIKVPKPPAYRTGLSEDPEKNIWKQKLKRTKFTKNMLKRC